MTNVRERLAWGTVAALALLVLAALASVVRSGPLDPPGAPSSTLPQVEPRIPISSLPFLITEPGSYFLTRNLTGLPSQVGIYITSDDVTVDLNGFLLQGPGGSNQEYGVAAGNGTRNVVVRNGAVRDWAVGVALTETAGNVVEDIVASNNQYFGIDVGTNGGAPNLVRNVVARANGTAGIRISGGTVRDSVIEGGMYGILDVGSAPAFIINNSVKNASSAGISAIGSRVEGNDVSTSVIGYEALPGANTLLIGNSAHANTTNYSISAGNTAGPIVTGANIATDSNPHANYAY